MRRLLTGLLAPGAIVVAALAHAAPISPPRALPSGAAAGMAAPADVSATGPCATRIDALPQILGEWAGRATPESLPTPNSTDAGEIAVLEDDGSFFYTNSGGATLVDLAAVSRAFYRTHGDDYDFLAIYLASGTNHWLGSAGALAACTFIRNDTQGIGLNPFDHGAMFGSPARLQDVLTMNGLHRYPAHPDSVIGGPTDTFSAMDVLAHEMGHRWLAYVSVDSAGAPSRGLLGRDFQHWNFFLDADSSFMEGCEWTRVGSDSFVTTGVSAAFGRLDHYLMGMRSKAETDSFFVVNDPSDFNPPGDYLPISVPYEGISCDGRATWWHVDDVEAVHGPRVPDAASAPRDFRMAFVLVVPRGAPATAADLSKLETFRQRFPEVFAASTWMRGSVDGTLDSRAGSVRIAHSELPDTEAPLAPRPVGARVTIEQAGIPLAVDPSSVRAWWRAGTSGAFAPFPLATAGPDSFAGTLPALAGPGLAQYWLAASSDSAGIDASLPAAGAAAPFTYSSGPDGTPPTIVHSRVLAQSRDLLPQSLLARVTDDLGVDSVWAEYRVGSGSLQSVAATRVGADSFAVSLGGGLPIGQTLAYRLLARDDAAAGNVATTNAAFDTLHVIHDWVEDFENGSAWLHLNSLYSWRDAWALAAGVSSPADGAAWHCGGPDPVDYPPHLDAVLYTPFVYNVTPGTTFTFDHRWGLEQSTPTRAWDGARIEVQVGSFAAPFSIATPAGGYTHTVRGNGMPFAQNSPCWSGASGWVRTTLDLTPYAPNPVRIRFRMCADDLIGGEGWTIDRVRVHFPDDATADAPHAGGVAASLPWPNPSRGALRLSLALPRAADVEWSLWDIAGRRVASLWKGRAAAGASDLSGRAARALAPGLYFSRLLVDGRTLASERVAIVR